MQVNQRDEQKGNTWTGWNRYVQLPMLSSLALSSYRSCDWETVAPAGDTCHPSHTYTNKHNVFSLCCIWQFLTGDSKQAQTIHSVMLSRLSMSFLRVSNYFPSSSCDVGGSSRISSCLQIPEWLTWTGQDFCSLYLFPPFLSFFCGGYFYSFVLRKQVQIRF